MNPQIKFARLVFLIAGIWGFLIVTPLYFLFDAIGQNDPPPITHPAFFYGFAGVALAWQVAFFIIAKDPARHRPIMIPSFLEKIGYGGAVVILFVQGRMPPADLVFGLADLLLAALFVAAYRRTAPKNATA
ncbi:MAG: hypothetical protein ABUS49_00960 [Acidobacteriota bacterium]